MFVLKLDNLVIKIIFNILYIIVDFKIIIFF